MNHTETINEINRLHGQWMQKNSVAEMTLNYEILKYYSWLRNNHNNIFKLGAFEPQTPYRVIARFIGNKRWQYKGRQTYEKSQHRA